MSCEELPKLRRGQRLSPGRIAGLAMALAWVLPGGGTLIGAPQEQTRGGTEISTPIILEVDPEPIPSLSDGNGVFEPGERVVVAPAWQNGDTAPQSLTGDAADFTGPVGPTYILIDTFADYGVLDPGAVASCRDNEDCYEMDVGPEGVARPATHWDTTFDETLSDGTTQRWALHVGDSFFDVPRTNLFYLAIETLLHHGVSKEPLLAQRDLRVLGCTESEFCPSLPTTRAQAAVFVLMGLEDGDFTPEPCSAEQQRFVDVPAGSPFCPWIEELARRDITAGCGGDAFCPADSMTRAQMSVLLLKALHGPDFTPEPCTGAFTDVTCPSPFADWIEELFVAGITVGCRADPLAYCPAAPVTRGQKAAFVTRTFGLTLYGPNAQNNPPVVEPATFTVAENSADGTVVGTVTVSDPDAGQSHTFAITAGNTDGAFAIAPSTGEITVADGAALDFETTPTFSLTVEATDDGTPPMSGSETVTVELTDANDPPAVEPSTFTVAENSPNGTVVGTVTVIDPDAGQSHTFVITAGNTDGAFAIEASTGEITVANSAALDLETTPTFSLTVEATDDGTPPLSNSGTVTVELTDANDPPAVDPATFTVAENSADGTVVGTVTFSDPDAGQSHTFAITGGNTDGAFAIGTTTGEITVANAAAVDFETTPTFTLTVEVTDDGTPALSGSATVSVELTDVNESPEVTPETFPLAENSADGAVVGTVTFSDPDAGQSHTFAITGGNTDGAFAIGTTTGEITVANTAALDFEITPTFALTVEVTDDGTPALSGSATVTVELTDVNESPEVTPETFPLAENSADGTVVGTVTFSDPDAGQSHTFAITGGNTDGAFAIGTTTGEITVANAAAVDFETTPTFTLTVEVTDDGTPALSGSATVSVELTDVNESPEVTPETFPLAENSADGAVVGTVTFSDPDAGQSHTFAITGGNTDGAFAIAPSTGEITVANAAALDFEITPTFALTVEVTDDGTPALSGSATVTVALIDVNEPPTANNDGVATDEDTAIVIDVLANDVDPDAGETLTIVAIGGSPTGSVTNNGSDVTYDPTAAFNALPEGGSAADGFTYTIEDSGGLQSTAMVTVTVSGLNDAPVAGDDAYSGIGNTQLAVEKDGPFDAPTFESTLNDVLENDADPDTGDTVGVIPFSDTLPSGAELDLAADGSFFYTPPPGQTTPDSFTYTLEDSFGDTDTGQVTIDIAKRVWYVDNTANGGTPGTGSGTATDPFSTLSDGGGNTDPDDAEDASAAGDIFYVHQGDGTATNQVAGITLRAAQWLLGEGVDLVVDPDDGGPEPPATLFTGNPANRPQVTHGGAGSAVTVLANTANGDRVGLEIRGLQLSSAGGNAIDVTSANAVDLDVRIAGNVVGGSGAEGIDVNVGSTDATQTLALHDNTITATGTGIDIVRTAGTLTITAFGNNTVTGATGGGGISVTGGGVVFDAVPGGSFDTVTGGTLTIGASGDPVGGGGLALVGVSGDLSYSSVDVRAGGGPGLRIAGTGSYTGAAGTRVRHLGAGTGVVTAVGGAAVDLEAVTADVRLATASSNNSSGSGVRLVGLADGTGTTAQFAAGVGSGINGAAGTAFLVDGGNATVAYGGTLSNASGRSVVVQNRTGDTATFSGAINDTGAGILVGSNAGGSTTSFQGDLILSTGNNAAFAAVNGGTVTATDIDSTLTTTSGTPLTVTGTSIGAAGLRFASITSNGAVNGVLLNGNTGSTGRLVVGPSVGGACDSPATCAGGAIQNSTGAAISLTNTRNASFTEMFILNGATHGIFGTTMTDASGGAQPTFELRNSFLESPGDGDNESAIFFDSLGVANITGRMVVADTTIQNFEDVGVHVGNNSGTVAIELTNLTVHNNSDTNGEEGVDVEASGTADITLDVSGGTFTDLEGGGFDVVVNGGSGSMDVDIDGITITGTGGPDNFPTPPSITFAAEGPDATFTFDITDNAILDSPGDGIFIGHEGAIMGRVTGNDISGLGLGDGLRIDTDTAASNTATILIDGNNFGNVAGNLGIGGDGIQVLHRDGTKVLNLTITNNQIKNTDSEGIRYFTDDDVMGGGPGNAVRVASNQFGNNGTEDLSDSIVMISQDSGTDLCTHIADNTTVEGITLQQTLAAVLQITQASTAALSAANGGTTVTPFGTITFNGTCTNPPLPTN